MAKILQSHHTLTNSVKTIISDFFELTKARLAISVVFSALAGYLIAVGEINVNMSVSKAHRFIRALTHPYPGAFLRIDDKKITIWKFIKAT